MLKLTLLVFAAVVASCTAQDQSFLFHEFNTLVCQRPGYIAGVGNVETPVPPEYIGLESGPTYKPVLSGFPSPLRGPMSQHLEYVLRDFLWTDYNDRLTSIGETKPLGEPILPSTILPLLYPPVSSGRVDAGVGTIYSPSPNATDQSVRDILNSLIVPLPEPQQNIIVDIVNQLNGRCEVMAEWVKLPHGQFFPQWVSVAVCNTSISCSMPFGLTCQPVLIPETLVRIIVLRWGCCWNIVNRQWRWECGWRKVYIPFITRCSCACFPVITADSLNGRNVNSYTGRIGGSFQTNVGGLNT